MHPMVDGNDQEWNQLLVDTLFQLPDVCMMVFQNNHYVWLAYTMGPASYGTCDIEIKTSELLYPHNLHVSAQLGEWEVGDTINRPSVADSPLWWNNDQWTANPLKFNGVDLAGGPGDINLKRDRIREIQLSKARFGKGIWELKFSIMGLVDSAGSFISVTWPLDESKYLLTVE